MAKKRKKSGGYDRAMLKRVMAYKAAERAIKAEMEKEAGYHAGGRGYAAGYEAYRTRKAKSPKARRAAWRACAGVNKRTGRVKSGYRKIKGETCPVPVVKKPTKAQIRKRQRAALKANISKYEPLYGARRRRRRRR